MMALALGVVIQAQKATLVKTIATMMTPKLGVMLTAQAQDQVTMIMAQEARSQVARSWLARAHYQVMMITAQEVSTLEARAQVARAQDQVTMTPKETKKAPNKHKQNYLVMLLYLWMVPTKGSYSERA